MAKAAKKETRRQARLERRAHEEAKQRSGRQTRLLWIIGGVLAAAVLVGIVAWNSTRPQAASSPSAAQSGTEQAPGQPASGQPAQSGVAATPVRPQIVTVKDQGREHLLPGQSHPAYNSNPPASGWHYPTTAAWGFHTNEFPDELLIHNLEHGGVWIAYKDDNDSAVVDPLVALAREFPRKLVVTHRPANDGPIAVVAWDHVMKLERFDRTAIVDFYNRFKNKGPEFVPD
ncbi:MAG TPA: DUF3105 domain-containing protein [bacterium]